MDDSCAWTNAPEDTEAHWSDVDAGDELKEYLPSHEWASDCVGSRREQEADFLLATAVITLLLEQLHLDPNSLQEHGAESVLTLPTLPLIAITKAIGGSTELKLPADPEKIPALTKQALDLVRRALSPKRPHDDPQHIGQGPAQRKKKKT